MGSSGVLKWGMGRGLGGGGAVLKLGSSEVLKLGKFESGDVGEVDEGGRGERFGEGRNRFTRLVNDSL